MKLLVTWDCFRSFINIFSSFASSIQSNTKMLRCFITMLRTLFITSFSLMSLVSLSCGLG